MGSEDCLYEPDHDSLILTALDQIYRMEYVAADSLLSTLPDIPARAYFRGLVLVNRFNDLGDTAALFQAERMWMSFSQSVPSSREVTPTSVPRAGDGLKCTGPCLELYLGLTNLQLSYLASLTKHSVRAAHLGRKAVVGLRPLASKAEASAYLALYDYYKAAMLKSVDWIPFVHADKIGPMARLEKSAQRSRYLKEILQTTSLWLLYDSGRFDTGLKILEAFLTRYPKNRLYRQIKADFHYRMGDLATARTLQEALQREYAEFGQTRTSATCLPIGYLSSVGNLAKIYATQNEHQFLKVQLAIWHSDPFRSTMNWLPSSLKKEVAAIKY